MNKTSWQLDWPLVGQDKVISFLEKSILADKIAQTYIFSGPKDLGKSSLALAFARNLWHKDLGDKGETLDEGSLNSDLYILEKLEDKKQISIDQVRDFNERLSLSSFFNSYKIGIIKEAHLLRLDAQNALLKTLEEPKENVLIILLTEQPEALLDTIISRSQLLYFYPVSSDVVYDYLLSVQKDAKRSQVKDMAAAASGRPLRALRYLEEPKLYQIMIERADKALLFISSDLSVRMSMIKDIFGEKPDRQLVFDYIENWEFLWRDALLVSLGQNDLMHYPAFISTWQKLMLELDLQAKALNALQHLQEAREYFKGAINLKNILENLAFHF